MSIALRCTSLIKHFADVKAVNGLNLEIRAGECFGLLGPNGAGKTTTVEMLEGLTTPDSGTIELLGLQWGTQQDQAMRERIGVALQETKLPEKATVEETIRLFRSFYARGHDVEEVIALVSLQEKRNARVGKLSGGQKQRLAVACALVSAPDLLFLDEPTTGLDPQARLQLWDVVEKFKAGVVGPWKLRAAAGWTRACRAADPVRRRRRPSCSGRARSIYRGEFCRACPP